ncbi:hypothetical protein HPP92_027086 [Vanilla planifolia]|uniref:Uncharacterized protein n=1 Tax=Vanilla planifolia TaxID=51239 RepID=A0A835U6V4_VANPL|nr:hypothetical protein HPP92_027086 [Vanilla planifolia]
MSTVNNDDEVERKASRQMLTEPIEWITYPSLLRDKEALSTRFFRREDKVATKSFKRAHRLKKSLFTKQAPKKQ